SRKIRTPKSPKTVPIRICRHSREAKSMNPLTYACARNTSHGCEALNRTRLSIRGLADEPYRRWKISSYVCLGLRRVHPLLRSLALPQLGRRWVLLRSRTAKSRVDQHQRP